MLAQEIKDAKDKVKDKEDEGKEKDKDGKDRDKEKDGKDKESKPEKRKRKYITDGPLLHAFRHGRIAYDRHMPCRCCAQLLPCLHGA